MACVMSGDIGTHARLNSPTQAQLDTPVPAWTAGLSLQPSCYGCKAVRSFMACLVIIALSICTLSSHMVS
jgi:hypothetical protein